MVLLSMGTMVHTKEAYPFPRRQVYVSVIVPVSARSASLYLVGFLLFEHVLPAVDASVGVGPPHVRGTRRLLSAV
jgi:hypothetical protein